jgi:DNA repair exonuclease SbcCD ATPase subunit
VNYGDSDSGTGDGSGSSSSSDGGDSRGQYPELARLISYIADTHLGDLGGFQGDEDVMGILEQILEQVDSSGSDGETARVGMDAYQLLLAMNALGADLDGDDNQQIVAELRQIRQQMGGGGMSSDELENALRTVLHDVFGQDLQGVIEGLDLADGFDEDAIVDAIENKDLDLSEVTDRLDSIEQAVAQIQSQGGDLGDVKQKLDGIESAVRDLQVDDQIFQDLTAEIRSLRNEGIQVNVDMNDPLMIKLVDDIQHSGDPQAERQRILQRIRQEGMITRTLLIQLLGDDLNDKSGRTGNKNDEGDDEDMSKDPEIQEVERRMDDDIKDEIENLEEEYEKIKEMVERQGDLGDAEELLQEDIQDLVNHLKKARQYEKELADFIAGKKKGTTTARNLEHGISEIKAQIDAADRAVSNFKDDFENVKKRFQDQRRLIEQTDYFEDRLEEQEEGLDELERVLERAIKGFEESEIDSQMYNQG